MQNVFTVVVAGALTIAAVTAATAQVGNSARAARAQAAPQTVPHIAPRVAPQVAPYVGTDPYGERPADPNAGVPCSRRPFALGCDKRGFW